MIFTKVCIEFMNDTSKRQEIRSHSSVGAAKRLIALVSSVPGIKFGLGFCEASGDRLVRYSGTDDALIELAKNNALSIACGHSFILFCGPPTFPVHILNTIKMVPEVCTIYCATANEVQLIVCESLKGRGIMGVIDGEPPLGVESKEDIQARRELLKDFGYKL